MDFMERALCKICNHETTYFPEDILIGDAGEFYILCEHCMNEIIL